MARWVNGSVSYPRDGCSFLVIRRIFLASRGIWDCHDLTNLTNTTGYFEEIYELFIQ
jgi:hypothetical protein